MGIPCPGKSSVEATMMMEGVIDQGEVLDKDHKVRIQLMEADNAHTLKEADVGVHKVYDCEITGDGIRDGKVAVVEVYS